jgi:hypothetical protein
MANWNRNFLVFLFLKRYQMKLYFFSSYESIDLKNPDFVELSMDVNTIFI